MSDLIIGCALLLLIGAVLIGAVLLIALDAMWLCPLSVLGVFGLIGRSLLSEDEPDE